MSDGIERVLRIPQSSSIIGISPSDCLVSYPGHSLDGGILPFCRDAAGVFYNPSQLVKNCMLKKWKWHIIRSHFLALFIWIVDQKNEAIILINDIQNFFSLSRLNFIFEYSGEILSVAKHVNSIFCIAFLFSYLVHAQYCIHTRARRACVCVCVYNFGRAFFDSCTRNSAHSTYLGKAFNLPCEWGKIISLILALPFQGCACLLS